MNDQQRQKRISFLTKRIAQLEIAIRKNGTDDKKYNRDADEQERLQNELDELLQED